MAREDRKPKDDSAAFNWRSFLQHLTSFAVLLLIAGIIVGVAIGVRPLERVAANVTGASHPSVEITWPEWKPGQTWLPRQFQDELLAIARNALGEEVRPFSGEPLARVGLAMEQSGWFDGTPRVERVDAKRIRVSGTWRTPAAVIRRDGKDYLVSWKGRRMPPVYQPDQSGFPIILNPVMPAPTTADGRPEFANAWPGEDIAASLELLREVVAKPWANQVKAIDASDYSSQSTLAIVTTYNTRIEWGGRFSKPRLGEAPTQEKVERLAYLFREHGRIDAGYPIVEVWQRHLLFDRRATAPEAEPSSAVPPRGEPSRDNRSIMPGPANSPMVPAARLPS